MLCETITALLTLPAVPLSFPPPAEPAQRQSTVRPVLGITSAAPLALQAATADVSRIERSFPPCQTPQVALPKSLNSSQVVSSLALIFGSAYVFFTFFTSIVFILNVLRRDGDSTASL